MTKNFSNYKLYLRDKKKNAPLYAKKEFKGYLKYIKDTLKEFKVKIPKGLSINDIADMRNQITPEFTTVDELVLILAEWKDVEPKFPKSLNDTDMKSYTEIKENLDEEKT